MALLPMEAAPQVAIKCDRRGSEAGRGSDSGTE